MTILLDIDAILSQSTSTPADPADWKDYDPGMHWRLDPDALAADQQDIVADPNSTLLLHHMERLTGPLPKGSIPVTEELLLALEKKVRASSTGLSIDYVPPFEGEHGGFRILTRHNISQPYPTLKAALAAEVYPRL